MTGILDSSFDVLKEGATQSSINGPVDADLSYYDWLKTQGKEFQDDVALGPTWGKLFRDGGLNADEFARLRLGKDFAPLSLADAERLNPLVFARAGL